MDKKQLYSVIEHYDMLQHYAEQSGENNAKHFWDCEDQIIAVILLYLEKMKSASAFRTEVLLDKMQKEVLEILNNAADDSIQDIDSEKQEIMKTESNLFFLVFALLGIKSQRELSKSEMDLISKYGKFDGMTAKQAMLEIAQNKAWDIRNAVSNAIDNEIAVGITMQEVQKLIERAGNDARANTTAFVNGIANDTALMLSAKNKTALKYIAVLDSRTCGTCLDLNGHIFSPDDDIPEIPQHYNCRCQLVPVIPDIENITYGEFFESLPDEEKKNRLGSAAYRQYKDGKYKVTQYKPNMGNNNITLKEIRAKDTVSLRPS